MKRTLRWSWMLALVGGMLSAAESPPAAQSVREALYAESHGLAEERNAILAAAQKSQPGSPLLQSYAGKLKFGDQFFSIDELVKRNQDDSHLAAYLKLREKTPDDFAGNVKLSEWCFARPLSAQYLAHLNRALDFQPGNQDIRRVLGHQLVDGDWHTREEMQERVAVTQEQMAANVKWLPIVLELKARLLDPNEKIRRAAAEELAAIRDPLAIAPLETKLGMAVESVATVFVEHLASLSDLRATAALARISVNSDDSKIREQAAKALANRDRDAYVPQLLADLHGRIESNFSLKRNSNGRVRYEEAYSRESQDKLDTLTVRDQFRGAKQPGVMKAAYDTVAQRRMDVAVENEKIRQSNERIMQTLTTATGVKNLSTPEGWWRWWDDNTEAFQAGPKRVEAYYVSQGQRIYDPVPYLQPRCECFVAGTPVWTSTGLADIEKIRVGDLVLAQDMKTGGLAMRAVMRTTVRPTEPLVRVTIGNESLDCTGGHLFWVVERGWTKARDLQPGMRVHATGNTQLVMSNESGFSEVTYNLVVDQDHNYFVGQSRLLTHDNSPRRATQLIAPGVSGE